MLFLLLFAFGCVCVCFKTVRVLFVIYCVLLYGLFVLLWACCVFVCLCVCLPAFACVCVRLKNVFVCRVCGLLCGVA